MQRAKIYLYLTGAATLMIQFASAVKWKYGRVVGLPEVKNKQTLLSGLDYNNLTERNLVFWKSGRLLGEAVDRRWRFN